MSEKKRKRCNDEGGKKRKYFHGDGEMTNYAKCKFRKKAENEKVDVRIIQH